jgi:large subunit ribosomal protein L9
MEVILLERVEKLGVMGEVVKVKEGYGRNFLLPQHKALRATEANKARFERDRATLEERNAERRKGAAGLSTKLEGKSFIILRQAGESGQLYGSVSTRDIADAAKGDGTTVSRGQVLLDSPIKTVGIYSVRVALHPEVIVKISVNVARSQEEAEAQARGEVLTGTISEREEARIAAEALFEQEAAAAEAATEAEQKSTETEQK